MVEVLKEEMKISLNENTSKQWKEMSKTVQDLKGETKSTKKTETEVNMEMKNIGTQTGISKTSLINRIKEIKKIEETISALKTK